MDMWALPPEEGAAAGGGVRRTAGWWLAAAAVPAGGALMPPYLRVARFIAEAMRARWTLLQGLRRDAAREQAGPAGEAHEASGDDDDSEAGPEEDMSGE